jgi:ATP adenylyltransferase
VTSADKSQGCALCEARVATGPGSLLLFQGRECFVVLNLFPYNNGHLMVVPNRHFATLSDATDGELCELGVLTRLAERALTETYRPQGLNVGMNLGRAAGAGVVDHIHIHVVPRWNGDTNFMSVVGETRVLPEEVQQTAVRLREAFAKLAEQGSSQ